MKKRLVIGLAFSMFCVVASAQQTPRTLQLPGAAKTWRLIADHPQKGYETAWAPAISDKEATALYGVHRNHSLRVARDQARAGRRPKLIPSAKPVFYIRPQTGEKVQVRVQTENYAIVAPQGYKERSGVWTYTNPNDGWYLPTDDPPLVSMTPVRTLLYDWAAPDGQTICYLVVKIDDVIGDRDCWNPFALHSYGRREVIIEVPRECPPKEAEQVGEEWLASPSAVPPAENSSVAPASFPARMEMPVFPIPVGKWTVDSQYTPPTVTVVEWCLNFSVGSSNGVSTLYCAGNNPFNPPGSPGASGAIGTAPDNDENRPIQGNGSDPHLHMGGPPGWVNANSKKGG